MTEILLSLSVSLASGLFVGFLLGRLGGGSLRREMERLHNEVARSEARAREQSRAAARMQDEQRTQAGIIRFFPTVIRDLNSSDLDPRKIPRLLIQLVNAIFAPGQTLLFLARSSTDDDDGVKELFLTDHRGLGEAPSSAKRIRLGEGKIGWVAENKVEMVAEDWLNLSRREAQALEDNHPSFQLDMIAPMVHHDRTEERLLGVLCIGSPTVRPKDEKIMLQMITNLGAIALINARNVSHLSDQANHDGLTGLLNKRYFLRRLGELVNDAEREARSMGLFIFDIDHFKKYNDSHGHLAGDELLRSISRVVRENIRSNDLACRYGGEEFVVTMPGADGPTAYEVGERVRDAVASYDFPHCETQPLGRLTISGGVAAFPVDGTNSTELISHADQALYKAKASGRNRVVRYQGVQIGAAEDETDVPQERVGEFGWLSDAGALLDS